MRPIQISTEVYAKIWSHRADGEEDENAILRRILGLGQKANNNGANSDCGDSPNARGKHLWRDDVKSALITLGGKAQLRDIYDAVRKIRLAAGRALPVNVEPIIRRELEYNCSASPRFSGKFDWFQMADGRGAGVWALRDEPLDE